MNMGTNPDKPDKPDIVRTVRAHQAGQTDRGHVVSVRVRVGEVTHADEGMRFRVGKTEEKAMAFRDGCF
jgi:hypothetical protein